MFAGMLPRGCINKEDFLVVRQCGQKMMESARQNALLTVCPLHLRLYAHLNRSLAWRHKYWNKKYLRALSGHDDRYMCSTYASIMFFKLRLEYSTYLFSNIKFYHGLMFTTVLAKN